MLVRVASKDFTDHRRGQPAVGGGSRQHLVAGTLDGAGLMDVDVAAVGGDNGLKGT